MRVSVAECVSVWLSACALKVLTLLRCKQHQSPKSQTTLIHSTHTHTHTHRCQRMSQDVCGLAWVSAGSVCGCYRRHATTPGSTPPSQDAPPRRMLTTMIPCLSRTAQESTLSTLSTRLTSWPAKTFTRRRTKPHRPGDYYHSFRTKGFGMYSISFERSP